MDGRSLGLDGDDATAGGGGGDPGNEPAAADRDDDRLDVRRVPEQLERERPLPRDHERVVEGMDERPARLPDVLLEVERLDGVGGLEVDRGAVAPRRRHLRRARARIHDDEAVDLSLAAPQASACAWFPAEIPITPRSRSAGVSVASLLRTPRALNEPVFWNSSAFCDRSLAERP